LITLDIEPVSCRLLSYTLCVRVTKEEDVSTKRPKERLLRPLILGKLRYYSSILSSGVCLVL
jgi:hypothetical protein